MHQERHKSVEASLRDQDMRYFAVVFAYKPHPTVSDPSHCMFFMSHPYDAVAYQGNERQLAQDVTSMCVRLFEKRIAPRLRDANTPPGYPDIVGDQNCLVIDHGDFLEYLKVAVAQQNRFGPDRYPVHIVGHPACPQGFCPYRSDVYSDFRALMGGLNEGPAQESQPLIFT